MGVRSERGGTVDDLCYRAEKQGRRGFLCRKEGRRVQLRRKEGVVVSKREGIVVGDGDGGGVET